MEAPAAQESSRKRKDRDAASSSAGPTEPASAPAPTGGGGLRGNLFLAGFLAHEFLSRGTILGERRAPGPGAAAAATGGAARHDAAAVLPQHGGARVQEVVKPTQFASGTGM